MTPEERTTLHLLRRSLDYTTNDCTKVGRAQLSNSAMAASQLSGAAVRLARRGIPLLNVAEYWMQLSHIEARAVRLASRAVRLN